MMRSLYVKILFGFVLIFAIAIGGFIATTAYLFSRFGGPDQFLRRTGQFHFEMALEAYQHENSEALRKYLDHLNRSYPMSHSFLDETGKDVLTGSDYSALLDRSKNHSFMGKNDFVVGFTSSERKYWLLIHGPPPGFVGTYPYYLWIPVLILSACFLMASQIIRPLRRLRRVVARFGQGDLSIRSGFKRKDEIGQLGREFDQMAQRIETLVLAEKQLLQDVSHELRSPLARLAFATELAQSNRDSNKAFDQIRKEIRSLTDLVSELIELNRAEGDPALLHRQVFCLNEVLQDVIEDFVVESEATRRELVVQLEQTISIEGRASLVRRAFENVISNAMRYASEAGIIEIRLRSQKERVLVTVRDFGCGVPEHQLGLIFKPFFRVDTDRNRASGGIGLGLTIAQRSVSICGGTISAKNANPGLEVTIEFPMR